jgi:hypothetical protein
VGIVVRSAPLGELLGPAAVPGLLLALGLLLGPPWTVGVGEPATAAAGPARSTVGREPLLSGPLSSAATVAAAATEPTVVVIARTRRARRPRRVAWPTRSPSGGGVSEDNSSLKALLNSSFISDVLLVV